MRSERATVTQLCQCLDGHLPAEPDWTEIAALANRTLVTPALAAALHGRAGVPDDVAAFLQAISARTAARNAMMHDQLVEASAALRAQGITPIVLKGTALLAEHGRAYDERLLADIDILIPYDQSAAAIGALHAIGYEADISTISSQTGANLQRSTDAGGIDLHYHLKLPYPGYGYAELVAKCTTGMIEGVEVLIPSPALQMATLIIHDQLQERDYWRGLIDLRHLLDLRNIMQNNPLTSIEATVQLLPSGQPQRAAEAQLCSATAMFSLPAKSTHRWSAAARLQHRRRMAQLRFRRLALPLTLLTLMADPPLRHIVTRRGAPGGLSVRSRAQFLRRMFQPPKDTKL